jgi:hypothetical protein
MSRNTIIVLIYHRHKFVEGVVGNFVVLSRYLSSRTEENTDSMRQNNQSAARKWKLRTPKYQTKLSPIQ